MKKIIKIILIIYVFCYSYNVYSQDINIIKNNNPFNNFEKYSLYDKVGNITTYFISNYMSYKYLDFDAGYCLASGLLNIVFFNYPNSGLYSEVTQSIINDNVNTTITVNKNVYEMNNFYIDVGLCMTKDNFTLENVYGLTFKLKF